MAGDVILNKIEIIERCLDRIDQEYDKNPENLHLNLTKQDSIILNLERACQAAIDLGMHLVRRLSLGLPKESRECFAKLEKAGVLKKRTSDKLSKMVGFRNLAIHDYQSLSLDVVQAILEKELVVFKEFRQEVFVFVKSNEAKQP